MFAKGLSDLFTSTRPRLTDMLDFCISSCVTDGLKKDVIYKNF